jgi:Kef-type K+ transport system membrane component KefB
MPTDTLLFQLTLVLALAVVSHFVVRRLKQPLVIGEIIVGILVGPSLIGFVLVDYQVLANMAQIGSIILLFLIGLESDLSKIYTKRNIVIAAGGVIVPFFVGYAVSTWMVPGVTSIQAIFIGATIVATSVAVTASVLMDMGLISSQVGSAVLGAAVVDDILAMTILAISGGIASGTVDLERVFYLIIAAVSFIVVGILAGTHLISRLIALMEKVGDKRHIEHTGFVLALTLAFLYAFIAEMIGISAIVGAFIAGTIFSGLKIRHEFEHGTKYLGAVFVPIFFITIGTLCDFSGLGTLLPFALVLTLIAIITKVIGCSIPARLMKMSSRESLAIGLGMVPRLEVALIIALYGLQLGVFDKGFYSVIVLVGILTALFTPPLLNMALAGIKDGGKDCSQSSWQPSELK